MRAAPQNDIYPVSVVCQGSRLDARFRLIEIDADRCILLCATPVDDDHSMSRKKENGGRLASLTQNSHAPQEYGKNPPKDAVLHPSRLPAQARIPFGPPARFPRACAPALSILSRLRRKRRRRKLRPVSDDERVVVTYYDHAARKWRYSLPTTKRTNR